MKIFLISCIVALMGVSTAQHAFDSATQGPNPQDIATPEPEYIDIEEPESEYQTAPAPGHAALSAHISAPASVSLTKQFSAPVLAPIPPSPVQFRSQYDVPATPQQKSFSSNVHPTSIAGSIAQSYLSPERRFQPLMQLQQVHQQQQQQQNLQHQIMEHFVYQEPSQNIAAGHVYDSQSGYQYRRPVVIRRVYRRRY